MPQLFADNVKSTLSVQLLSNATSLRVADFSKFPALTTGSFFKMVITMGLDYEVVKVTGSDAAQSMFYIDRAQDGSTAKTWPAGETTVFIGPVAADAALAARWETGYPIYNVPANGQLKKFHCNVLTGNTSTYTWPSNPVLGDALEIINHTSSAAVRTINNTFTLDIRTLVPTKLICENLSAWVFRATKLSELIGLLYANLIDRPVSLNPTLPGNIANAGPIFVYADNAGVRINGAGTFTMFPPVNIAGRVAKSVLLHIVGSGGSISFSGTSDVITIDQAIPGGMLLYVGGDGNWEVPYTKTSEYAPGSKPVSFPNIPTTSEAVVPGVIYMRQGDSGSHNPWGPSFADVEQALPGDEAVMYTAMMQRFVDPDKPTTKMDIYEIQMTEGTTQTTNAYSRIWLESAGVWLDWVKTNTTWDGIGNKIMNLAAGVATKVSIENAFTEGNLWLKLSPSLVQPQLLLDGSTGSIGMRMRAASSGGPQFMDGGSNVIGYITPTEAMVSGGLRVDTYGRMRIGQRYIASLPTTGAGYVTLFSILPTSSPWVIEGYLSVPSQHYCAKVKFGGTVNSGPVGPLFEWELVGAYTYYAYYPATWRVRIGAANTGTALDFKFVGTASNPNAAVEFVITNMYLGGINANTSTTITVPLAWNGAGDTTGGYAIATNNSGAFNFKKVSWTAGAANANTVNPAGTIATIVPASVGVGMT